MIDLQKMLDDRLIEDQRSPRKRSGKFNIRLLGRCYRLQYWDRMDEEKTNPPNIQSLRKFRAGHVVEEEFVKGLSAKDLQVRVETEHFIGYADIVDDLAVIDIKSCGSWQWEAINRKGYDLYVKNASYVYQVLKYAKELGKEFGVIAFVSKDEFKVKRFQYAVKDYLQTLESEELNLLTYWLNGRLPPALPRAYPDKYGKAKECQYCPFKTKCEEVESGS